MKQLKEITRAQRKQLNLLRCNSVLIGALIVAQAYFIVEVVDRIFLQGNTFQDIVPFLGGLLAVLVARAIFTYVNGRAGITMASKVKNDFRQELLGKYARNPIQASLKGQSGQKVSILMDAVDEIDGYFSKYYPQMIQTSIVPLIILAAVYYQNWVSGLIMTITAPFIPLFMAIIGSATQKKSEEQLEKLGAFSGRFLDILQGLVTLKFFGRAKEKQAAIRQSSLDYRDATMSVLKIAFTSSLMLEFISMLSIALVALEVGFRLVIYEQLTFFTAFFVLILVPEFFATLKDLGSAFHTGRGSMGAAKKIIDELEEKEQPVRWGEQPLYNGKQPPAVTLKNVSFSYGEGEFSLKNIDADMPPGSDVAVVGPSGSGKTTLLHLLSGLVAPSAGAITVNGRSLYDYKESDWLDRLIYISQDPYLFSGTVEENIAVGGNGIATREEIVKAAEKAGIADMIDTLEGGYDTRIGEGGRGLSGGEKQRIALARAFLKQPSIIIFDEPTVGLDLKTEQILQTALAELRENSTVITVAHRLYTIRKADQILFLADGRLAAKGTHEELMAAVPEYSEMIFAQQGGAAG
ncbi:ATP-binding cassette, subfamily C, CydD [Evansella caseinilytica]|uniref:ATP-binding cassette, subfamily C, CydD n=1 Tax=Evansella caseinilytica TaxID=1503961 RepID=A0A1H3QBL3_9BACI|nr:thiol reductant ABC exporter subunit CydD [Evansella caseinilytica]SDZ10663.1 ATP-binding cassette, subfamily C, CydD [Evansella caseinilytica]